MMLVNYRQIARNSPKFCIIFNGLCSFVMFFFFFYNRVGILNSAPGDVVNGGSVFGDFGVIHRRIGDLGVNDWNLVNGSAADHVGWNEHDRYDNECEYFRANPQTCSGGFINYLTFFYCDCQKLRALGYLALLIWLAALFYLLGNTAADYFCCSLEKLSDLLRLPPTVAGVVLLPLGNGAPDVFASIAAFVGTDAGEVGLNSVMGGVLFVTCIVVGVISLVVAKRGVHIDRRCFIRDTGFFLLSIVVLLLILICKSVSVGVAISFVSIYGVYAFCVAANELLRKHAQRLKLDVVTPLLPVRGSMFSLAGDDFERDSSVYNPLLDVTSESSASARHMSLPQWMWASNVAIYSNHGVRASVLDNDRPPWGWTKEEVSSPSFSSRLLSLLEIPLSLPRRLTIPLVQEDSWSKAYAVASALFAPILIALLWGARDNVNSRARLIAHSIGAAFGFTFSILAYGYTVSDHPPRRFLIPWVLGGFIMSIAWFYIIANELVALLVTFGTILGIKPSILALTVLAWGNSMGDLMSNVALARNSDDGVQIALSGCYAGPMFNTLVGLGASMLIGACARRPEPYVIPEDFSLFYSIGFVLAGLIYALISLLRSEMRPNKELGVGLITIYMIFLFLRVISAVRGY